MQLQLLLPSQVLTVHPTLPAHLDTSSLPPLFHFVEDPWFRARLPCATVTSLIQKPGISATLPVSVLENVLTSRRLLACLPASFLEQVCFVFITAILKREDQRLELARKLTHSNHSALFDTGARQQRLWPGEHVHVRALHWSCPGAQGEAYYEDAGRPTHEAGEVTSIENQFSLGDINDFLSRCLKLPGN